MAKARQILMGLAGSCYGLPATRLFFFLILILGDSVGIAIQALANVLQENRLENLTQQDAADLRVLISKTLHEIQPWFHGPLSRLEAEARIEEIGHMDGRFLYVNKYYILYIYRYS